MKVTLLCCVMKAMAVALWLADTWLWPQIALTHRVESIREWARLKLDNERAKDDEG